MSEISDFNIMKRQEHYISPKDKSFRIKFGKHIANSLGNSSKKIKYLSNSCNYPNTVTLTSDDLAYNEIFGIIRKDNKGNIIDTYVLSSDQMVFIMKLYQENNKNLVTKYNQDTENKGVLARIPYSYMESYRYEIK